MSGKKSTTLGKAELQTRSPCQKNKKKMIMGLTVVESHLMGIQKVLRGEKKL